MQSRSKPLTIIRRLLSGNIRRFILIFLVPLGLLPIPLVIGTPESKCAYGVLLMSCYWLLELLPLAVTALIPVFLFPMLGLLTTNEVCQDYMKETLIIFLGSLIAATAVEHCNLHQRIALRVLLLVGTSPKWLLLGSMGTATFLSMWISNTAATALMIPILEAVVLQLKGRNDTDQVQMAVITDGQDKDNITPRNSLTSTDDMHILVGRKVSYSAISVQESPEQIEQFRTLRNGLYLGLCYAANIGGTGTMTGTPPNLILKQNIGDNYSEYHGLTFASWMMFNIPGMLVCIAIAWVFLYIFYIRKCETNKESQDNVEKLILKKYQELQGMTFHEGAVLFLFVVLVLLFFFREPEFIPGWASLFKRGYIQDACAAIFIVVLMFIVPANPKEFSTSPPLLNWKVVQDKVSWGLVLLLGGGFAMSDAAKKSHLDKWLASQLGMIDVTSVVLLEMIVCAIVLVLTEITSNTATATIILPVIGNMAEVKGLHPLVLMMPAAICCSYSFMLPIATAPNAIIFDAAGFKSSDMAIPGLVMKFLCLFVIIGNMKLLGNPVLGVSEPLPVSWSSLNLTATTEMIDVFL